MLQGSKMWVSELLGHDTVKLLINDDNVGTVAQNLI